MVFNHKLWIFILKTHIHKQLFKEVRNEFMVKLSTLQQALRCLKLILHFFEKVLVSVSFKNKTSLWLKTMTHSQNNEYWMTLLNVNVDTDIFALLLILITPCLASFVLYEWHINFSGLGKHMVTLKCKMS